MGRNWQGRSALKTEEDIDRLIAVHELTGRLAHQQLLLIEQGIDCKVISSRFRWDPPPNRLTMYG